MSKILIDEALRLADAIELGWLENVDADKADIDMIQTELRRLHAENQALRQALAEAALDKMADNARKLGLSYDASVVRIDTSTERVDFEAAIKHIPVPPECKTEAEKTAFAFGWFKALESVRKEPAPAQEPIRWADYELGGKRYKTMEERLKDAFYDGFASSATYNDIELNDVDEEWLKYAAKNGITKGGAA
jgi:hypothetical protein